MRNQKTILGYISDIQRFSLGDGDGIRTTVFMQGCNLCCPWCHNPETININGSRLFYKHLCVSCGRCKTDENTCPNGAIKISGKRMSLDEVFAIITQDTEFYKKSNGGITLSGGEPLLQIDFCTELARKCRENNISVIIDTAGDVSFETFEKIIPFTNCFYFDLKTDINGYQKISANGERIYDNLSRLSTISKTVARIPIVPGFNDSIAAMESFAVFLSTIKISGVHLLPFHRLGSGKYKALGQTYAYEDHPPTSPETLLRCIDIFTRKHLQCEIE